MGCLNTCVVNAPVETVWTVLRDFHDLSWAPTVVASVERVGAVAGTSVGAKRVLNGVFHETLLSLDDGARVLTYSIDDGPDVVSKDRVSGYVGQVRVVPITDEGSTFVEWSSRWDASDGDVAAFCNPIYKALLDSLKTSVATR